MLTPAQINPTFITTACYFTSTIQIFRSGFINQLSYLMHLYCNISATLQNPTISRFMRRLITSKIKINPVHPIYMQL
ncbi:hypothetical protein Peur_000525 [Populus x canadensis]